MTRQFVVRHIRDKKGGGVALTEERDIYELAANMGQRRVRACLLELIPADIVEAAVKKCKNTLADGGGVPLEDRVRAYILNPEGRTAEDEVDLVASVMDFNRKVAASERDDLSPITGASIRTMLRRSERPGKRERLRAVGGG